MAAPMTQTLRCSICSAFYLQKHNHIHPLRWATSVTLTREYSNKKTPKKPRRRHKRSIDPRKNIQYPYIHEAQIGRQALDWDGEHGHRLKLKANGKKPDVSVLDVFQKKKNPDNFMHQSTTASGLLYTKLKDGDVRLGRSILSIKSKLALDSSNLILLEGERLIRDSLLLGAELKYLYFSDENLLRTLPSHLLKEVDLFNVLYKDLKTWLDTTTPSGIMGIFKKPQQGEIACPSREDVLPISLILDGVKDPGNAGTLVRTAAAVGCKNVLALKGCVNMWEGKVLRSGMGGHFAVPIYTALDWSQVYNYVHEKSQVILAEPKPSTLPPSGDYSDLQKKLEAFQKQEMDESDSSDDERSGYRVFDRIPLPSSLYCDINLQSTVSAVSGSSIKHVSLVVGGEATGLSPAAKRFAYDYYGQYVSLPMAKNIDSLNTSVAAGVILYELRRKLLNENSF